MTAPARRPWWKRKRTAAALALWLAVVYPLSFGPYAYADARGWCSSQVQAVAAVFYRPSLAACGRSTTLGAAANAYDRWWIDLALRHAASD